MAEEMAAERENGGDTARLRAAAEIQELTRALEEKSALLSAANADVRIERERCRAVELSLRAKCEELRLSNEARDGARADLRSRESDLASLRQETSEKIRAMGDSLSTATSQWNEASKTLKARSDELQAVLKDLDAKQARVVTLEAEVQRLRDKTSALEFSVNTLQGKNANMADELREAEKQRERVCDELSAAETEIHRGKATVAELQLKVDLGSQIHQKLEKANERVKELESILNELGFKQASAAAAQAEAARLREKNEALEFAVSSLQGKAANLQEELKEAEKQRTRFCNDLEAAEAEVSSGRAKLTELQLKLDLGCQIGEKLDRANARIKELEAALEAELDSSQTSLLSLKAEAQRLREQNSGLDFSLGVVQAKNSNLVEELRESHIERERICDHLAVAEAELARSKVEVTELQLRVDLGTQIHEKLEKASARIKELEAMQTDLAAFAREKDEKLDASEWAVQQLGLYDVSRAKASLADAMAECTTLREEYAVLEETLKLKEEESICLRKALSDKEAEYVEMQRVGEMRYEQMRREHENQVSRMQHHVSSVLEGVHSQNKGLVDNMLLLHDHLLREDPIASSRRCTAEATNGEAVESPLKKHRLV